MSATTHHDLWTSDVTPTPSRRRCERQHLTWALVYVELGPDNGGIVLNISNDGFSIQAAMPLTDDGMFDMRLKGGRDTGWTEVSGRIVWMSETQTVAGIQFVDLSGESRERIAEWIALEASPPLPERRPSKKTTEKKPLGAAAAPEPRPIIEPPITELPAPHADLAASHLPRALTSLDDRRIVSWQIVLLAVLTFAAGLLLGHGVLGRSSSDPTRLAARVNDPPAASTRVPAKIENQASAVAAPGSQPPNSLLSTVAPSGLSASGSQSTGVLANRTPSGDVRESAAQTQSPRNERETPRGTADTSITRRDSPAPESTPGASARSGAENREVAVEQPLNAPQSSLPASLGSVVTQPANASSPPVIPDASSATETAHSSSPASSGGVAEASISPAVPKADSRAPEEIVSVSRPAEIGTQSAQSPGPINPSRLIRSVQPIYPQGAKRQKVEGDVQLRVVVGTDGSVRSVGLVDGPPVFVSAAMTAARQFRYSPALLNGQAIETIQTINMSFRLKN